MLRYLFLQNVYLFSCEKIFFEKGLNIITGETGSGKTTILSSIAIILGGKTSNNIISKGSDFGVIESGFIIKNNSLVKNLLHSNNFSITSDEIILRREIHLNGKNRCFINDQITTLSFFKEIGEHLIEVVKQNTSLQLLTREYQSTLIDMFGDVTQAKQSFTTLFLQRKNLQEQLEKLKLERQEKTSLLQNYIEEKNEIEQVNIQQDEEDNLTEEHHLLSNLKEIQDVIDTTNDQLFDKEAPLSSTISSVCNELQKIIHHDNDLSDTLSLLSNISIELEEISYNIAKYQSKLDVNPLRLNEVEDRLQEIHTLQKKYGSNYSDLQKRMSDIDDKISEINNFDIKIESLQQELNDIISNENASCHNLSSQRQTAARKFETAIQHQLKQLNINNADFTINLSAGERTVNGEDIIEFLFSANIGIEKQPLKECASGGELSRVMLAIKTILSSKDKKPSILFDEIDANIGGTTATIIGEKLKSLSCDKQIFLITHFMQVAAHADHHYLIKKTHTTDKTSTTIKSLKSIEDKQMEYNRMMGK
jgi:DNA repair protein RecN (Recombination protein N)